MAYLQRYMASGLMALTVWATLGTTWAEGPSVAEQIRERQRQAMAPEHRESISKRRGPVRNGDPAMQQFVDKSGVMTFTNRPDKYERDRTYTPVNITYKPIVVPAKYQSFKSPKDYTSANVAGLISRYASLYNLEEELVYAVIKAESNFNANATSPAGACGLMQLMPGTAAEMGVTRVFDPAQNIAGGSQYLAKMLELFNGDERLALAGYNAGPNAVKQHGGIPPYKETRAYVERVARFKTMFKRGGAALKTNDLKSLRADAPKMAANKAAAPGKPFVVHFHSGLTQPADRVVDKDPYYYIEFGTLTYPVRKDLVKKIAEG